MESVNRAGNVWHKSCFQCGVLSDVGCRRVLLFPAFPEYFYFYGCPFCHGCANKYFLHGRPKFRVVKAGDTNAGAGAAGGSSTLIGMTARRTVSSPHPPPHPHSQPSLDSPRAGTPGLSSSSLSDCNETDTDVSILAPQSSVQLKFRSQVLSSHHHSSLTPDYILSGTVHTITITITTIVYCKFQCHHHHETIICHVFYYVLVPDNIPSDTIPSSGDGDTESYPSSSSP